MPITQAVCKSWKSEIISGIHLAANTFKLALFTSAATLDKTTTAYTGQAGEVANGNGYATGGVAVTGFTVTIVGDRAVLRFTGDPAWAAATITARGGLLYNDTLGGKNAVCVIDFGADKTSTNGTFTVDLAGVYSSGVANVSFASGTKKISRLAGSWITDGFIAGHTIVTSSATNPGPFTITLVSALDITVTEALTDQGAATTDVCDMLIGII